MATRPAARATALFLALALAATFSAMVIGTGADLARAEIEGTVSDPPEDFRAECDVSTAATAGPPALDIVEVRADRIPDGADFVVRTRGDIAARSREGKGDSFVAQISTTGGHTYEAVHILGSTGVTTLSRDGVPTGTGSVVPKVSGSTLTLRVRGLTDPVDGAHWSFSTLFTDDAGRFFCDDVAGPASTTPPISGVPAPPGSAATPDFPTTAPLATTPATPPGTALVSGTAPAIPAWGSPLPDDGERDVLWWLVALLCALGFGVVGAIVWAWRARLLRARRAEVPVPHPIPPATPPPDQNDFGR